MTGSTPWDAVAPDGLVVCHVHGHAWRHASLDQSRLGWVSGLAITDVIEYDPRHCHGCRGRQRRMLFT